MIKKKLTINEQIEHMKDKGIKFEIISIEDARKYLSQSNYYFKLKSYAKNFNKYSSTEKNGQYLHLDFAYIKELFKYSKKTITIYFKLHIQFL